MVAQGYVGFAVADQRIIDVVEARLVERGAAPPIDVVAQKEHEIRRQAQVRELGCDGLLAVGPPLGEPGAVARVAEEDETDLPILGPLRRAASSDTGALRRPAASRHARAGP